MNSLLSGLIVRIGGSQRNIGSSPSAKYSGWQIVIDESSLQKYQDYSGVFKERLQCGIDKEESCFRQHNMRCSMLAFTGLCDLQSTLGESYLCDTCRQYPRCIEEFADFREYSLSLSCPEYVRMLLEPAFHFELTETEDDTFDDPDDFEDFDPFLFDELTFAREELFSLSKDHSQPLQKRMDQIAAAAFQLQILYDEGNLFEMGDIAYGAILETDDDDRSGFHFSYEYMVESIDLLQKLEVLESSWTDTIRSTKEYWMAHSAVSSEWSCAMFPNEKQSFLFEKLLQSLLFSYFCGSVYDGQIYARAMIPIMSVRWIMMISFAHPELSPAETIYLFSREVEHSDLNIHELISYFEEEL